VPESLAAVPLFAGVDPARLRRLAARSAVRAVPAGSVVALHGEPADHLIVVEAGTLSAVREAAGGRRMRLGEFAAPCAVDKSAVLDGGGHTATWLAATRCRLRFVPAAELFALLGDIEAARRHVLTVLSRQLRDRQEELVRGRLGDTATRTAAWLVRAADRSGRRVVLPGAQQGLAEAIGASRVSVNRALRTLARAGLIRTEPGAVVILAPELLARRAGG
jgi:CRP/FNR family transcriptional regulator